MEKSYVKEIQEMCYQIALKYGASGLQAAHFVCDLYANCVPNIPVDKQAECLQHLKNLYEKGTIVQDYDNEPDLEME